ncbi:centrosomal protein 43-like [Tubulanus polymorphus]|uniref:centrosomal protein 43-like n=1 Tax=Tubulanus polymorphus TaxID=672921 RepID=UPI003DA5382E
MAAEEDTELRDLVAQSLENNGVLGKIRAQLRASVFLALEEQEHIQNKKPFVNQKLQKFLSTKEGCVVAGLVREFLEYFGLEFTLAVFDPESGFRELNEGRHELARELNIIEPDGPASAPLLAEFVKRSTSEQVSRGKLNSTTENYITKDLSQVQIDDAKEKFKEYDKDQNGVIDKDELRNLFVDMFPNFHRNMLERYVNDEFRASDRDFSNGIDFDEFVAMYKRLFILCKSVVSHDLSELKSPRKSNSDSLYSKIPSPIRKPNSAPNSPTIKMVNGDAMSNQKSQENEKSLRSSISEQISERSSISEKQTNGSAALADVLGSEPEDDPFFDDPLPITDKSKPLVRKQNKLNPPRSPNSPKPSQIPKFTFGASDKKEKTGSSLTHDKPAPATAAKQNSGNLTSLNDLPSLNDRRGVGGLGSLKDVPPLPGLSSNDKGKQSDLEKDIKAIDKKIADLGFDVPDDDDYEEDFMSSGYSRCFIPLRILFSPPSMSKLSARSEKSEQKTLSIAEEIDEEVDEDLSGADDLLKSSNSGFDDLTTDKSISVNSTGGFDYMEDVITP